MTTDPSKSKRSRKSFRFYFAYGICLLFFTAVAAEVIARLMGKHPWTVNHFNIKVEPGGRLFQPKPVIGYTQLPGQFKITLNDVYTYTTTNRDNTLRITHPLDTYPAADKQEIWVLGDSVTYGQSVNDWETFCWLLQQKFPNYEFVDFGVEGYGNLQSLIQLREAFQTRKPPRLVILVYGSWQDVRNTLLRARKKMLTGTENFGPVSQPYARLRNDGSLEIAVDNGPFREFPLMRYSAFMNTLEESYDRYEERHARSHDVTKAIIGEMARECQAKGIQLVLASLTSDPTSDDTLRFSETQGIKPVSIWVDLSKAENNNLPYDSHPNAHAHQLYAQKLGSFLSGMLQPGRPQT